MFKCASMRPPLCAIDIDTARRLRYIHGAMNARRVLIGVFILGVVHSIYYFPQLPRHMASHFNALGGPDSWSSRLAFYATYLGGLAFTTIMFLAIPYFLRRVPHKWVNLPNRDYWLAPSRVDESLARFGTALYRFGAVTNAFMIFAFQCTVIANLRPSLAFPNEVMVGGVVFYFAFTAIWVVTLLLSFRKTHSQA
ncbi:MAG: DUF1648 domain-containing protein [Chitinivibrionales bacterium]|nr:DUF1648 domain-containing protein [Chitinivibrionales bacterium]MBD3395896.1 DUF1648 domain-containing protein [Chitinivibrionales bacterium]